MWRYVANCVREGFQRGVGAADVRCGATNAAGGQGPRATAQGAKLSVSDAQGPCDSNRHSGANHHSYGWFQKHLCEAWINAFTWSGAIVLGWYASHSTCFRRRNLRWDVDFKELKCKAFLTNNIKDLQSTILTRIAYAQPQHNVPRNIKTFNLNNIHSIPNPVHVSNDSGVDDAASNADADFKNVVRSIENKLGITAIQEGNAREGIVMLRSAARKDYAPALYNLALCYEKGLGVKRDETMAMELYRAAASRNHPGAMYNLAIFYGQGRGGLDRDPIVAEDLLRIAAANGQKEAIAALKSLTDKKLQRAKANIKLEENISSTVSFLKLINCEENISQHPPTVLLY